MTLIFFFSLLSTFLTSFLLTKYFCSPTTLLGFLDHPNERSLHSRPTPRTGGLGILGGILAGSVSCVLLSVLAGFLFTKGEPSFFFPLMARELKPLFWLLLFTGLLAGLSFWDDRHRLTPTLRLIIQFLLASLFMSVTSSTIDVLKIPLLGTFPLGKASGLFTLLFLVWMTNLYNFMDGMDGFAGGMTVLGCCSLSLLAWDHGAMILCGFSILIAAAAGGFLVSNFPPAKIFMGDVGSASLGFLIGGMTVMGVSNQHKFDLWSPILIFSPFIVDATVTLMKRLLRGQKFWTAHREHYYQRLVLYGWGHRKTVMAEYVLMITCGSSALIYSKLSSLGKLVLLLSWALIYVSLATVISLFERKSKRGLVL